jgi:hypothetical protein
MANVNRPQGLKPVKSLISGDYDGRGNVYYIPANDATYSYYSGDVVTSLGDGDANGVPGIVKYIPNAAAAGAGINGAGPLGVIVAVGINPSGPWINPTDLTVRSAPQVKTRAYYALVVDDPFVIFEVQEGGAGTALTSAAIGLNCNLSYTAAQSTGYESGTILDNASEVATIGLDVRLMGLSRVSDNAFGYYAKWLVMLNSHFYKMTTGI